MCFPIGIYVPIAADRAVRPSLNMRLDCDKNQISKDYKIDTCVIYRFHFYLVVYSVILSSLCRYIC